MIDRRMLLLSATSALLASPVFVGSVIAADDPAAPIAAIYRRIAARYASAKRDPEKHSDDDNGYFVWRKASRHRYLTRAFAALWDRSDALTPKGDEAPPGADPITASQDPMVRDPKVETARRDGTTALVVATFLVLNDERVRVQYDMVREGGAKNGTWKIDDIRTPIDNKPDQWWSTRKELGFNAEAMRTGTWIDPPKTSPNYQSAE